MAASSPRRCFSLSAIFSALDCCQGTRRNLPSPSCSTSRTTYSTLGTETNRPGPSHLIEASRRITMHGPNGTDFENESQIVEFAKPERIVFEHLRPFHWYRMTMTYRAVGEQTELKWVMNLETSPDSEKMKAFIGP